MLSTKTLDVLVIGAGQAGLAMGHELKQRDRDFLIIDQHERIGESWRRRFDSLTLFTPRSYSALPGLPVPGDPAGYPTKDEIADYLASYAAHFALPVRTGAAIDKLERVDSVFQATTTDGDLIAARTVVVATGAFQMPVIPPMARRLAAGLPQLTTETYRNPEQLPAGTILVAGDGATGRQIARELNGRHTVILATGRSRRVSPHRLLGKSIFWWMDKLGILRLAPDSAIGGFLQRTDPFPGKDLALKRLRKQGITIAGRLAGANGRRVAFADGQTAEIDAVLWATGYRDETAWVAIPEAADERGAFTEQRGVSPVPGLFFIGRSWQTARGSALITGVGHDAVEIAGQVLTALGTNATREPAPAIDSTEAIALAAR
jgi:putative flavoprotein involved in K+ transport